MTVRSRSDSTPRARILLIGGNKSGLAARKAILEEQGHKITTSPGGEDAFDQFGRGKFDLVVTDYRMAHVDGVGIIQHVREIDPGVRVILLSGYVEAYGLDESNTGADIVLSKGANEVAHLIRAVNRLLRRTSAQRKPPARQKAPTGVRRRAAGQ
ncbi:MAG: response regulator [Bryobacteraceae bacterium]